MVLLVEAKLNSMEAPAVFKADLQLIAVDTFAGNFGCRDITSVKCSMEREGSSLHF